MHGSGWNGHRDANRSLGYAVVASILAHALILLGAPGLLDSTLRKPDSRSAPLVAHLVPPRPVPSAAPAAEPSSPVKPDYLPKKARALPPVPRAQPSPPAPPAPLSVPAQAAPPSVTAAEPPRAVEPSPAAAPAQSAQAPQARIEASPSPAHSTPSTGEAADPQTLGQYRIAIITAAKRYKRYPRLAIDNHWEGQAEIRMVIGTDGSIVSIAIKSRSGFEVLDQQAVEMIRKAKPLTPIPSALRGKAFTVDVPVVFSLKEETG